MKRRGEDDYKVQSVGWQGARPGAEIPLDMLIQPPPTSGPDYARLVEVLLTLRQYLDTESGETILTTDEAASIRACGLAARGGLWRCPLLPNSLVCFRPALRLLSDLYGPETRGCRWHPKRAAVLSTIAPMDPLESLGRFERRLMRRLQKAPGHCLPRSALKRTFQHPGARFVDFTVDRLIAADYITEHGGLLYPFSKAAFNAWREAQSRPRRPVPVSITY